ncbi:hypothetical protein NHX12_025320 [Muraenolepis orangiensis]|uniref:Uncharacterized protein n=1 Tax=Muraenolepis orangiensis TaxID=630683 RepID=A0A9Q0EJX7_9TELE|nr:hypothetical protein NHX12_025320 [Muraenolepis orangiensis]
MQKNHKVHLDLRGRPGRPPETPKEPQRPAETPRDLQRPPETPRDHQVPPETCRDPQRPPETIRDPQVPPETCRDPQRPPGTPRDPQRPAETPRDNQLPGVNCCSMVRMAPLQEETLLLFHQCRCSEPLFPSRTRTLPQDPPLTALVLVSRTRGPRGTRVGLFEAGRTGADGNGGETQEHEGGASQTTPPPPPLDYMPRPHSSLIGAQLLEKPNELYF